MNAGRVTPFSFHTLTGRRTRRRLGIVTLGLVAALSALTGSPAAAVVTATTVTFEHELYQAPVGSPTPITLQVTVRDATDAPVDGALVTFSSGQDAVNSATAALSSTTATTDAQGVASVTATVPNQAALFHLTATVDGVTGHAYFAARPQGYQVGEQLASVVAEDQTGARRDIRTALQGKTWVLVDVCAGWCAPCRFFADEVDKARAELWTRYRIRLEVVTLLKNGGSSDTNPPSTRQDAVAWKNHTSGNVYHAEGSRNSALYRAGEFFNFAQATPQNPIGGFPTNLLVNPKGAIVDALVGGQLAEDFVARVVTASGGRLLPPIPSHDPRKPVPALGTVSVDLAGQTASQTFTGPGQVEIPFGVLHLDYANADLQQRIFGYSTSAVGIALPESGNLGLTLTPPKGSNLKLASPTLATAVFGELGTFETNDYVGLYVDTTLPAVPSTKNTSVLVGVQALRAKMRTELEAGHYTVITGTLPELTPEVIDALVASTYGIDVTAGFTGK